jgi:hypothetical protein
VKMDEALGAEGPMCKNQLGRVTMIVNDSRIRTAGSGL